MNTWDKWVKRPQTIWFRRLLFQVHLWSGIDLGVYILVVCLSGSAAVFNNELYVTFLPAPKIVEITGRNASPQSSGTGFVVEGNGSRKGGLL